MEIVVAVGQNTGIGFQNKLPWHLPADLAHFKKLTTGHVILMGRKTYESIGKALPNRENWVLSRGLNYQMHEIKLFQHWDEILNAEKVLSKTLFLIGGAQLYKYAIENQLVSKVHLTRVHVSPEADTFFPDVDPSEFQLINTEIHEKDKKNAYDYQFETWEKIF